jgi:hypothetical protein
LKMLNSGLKWPENIKRMAEDGQVGVAPTGKKGREIVPVTTKKPLWKEVSCGLLDDNRTSCRF